MRWIFSDLYFHFFEIVFVLLLRYHFVIREYCSDLCSLTMSFQQSGKCFVIALLYDLDLSFSMNHFSGLSFFFFFFPHNFRRFKFYFFKHMLLWCVAILSSFDFIHHIFSECFLLIIRLMFFIFIFLEVANCIQYKSNKRFKIKIE